MKTPTLSGSLQTLAHAFESQDGAATNLRPLLFLGFGALLMAAILPPETLTAMIDRVTQNLSTLAGAAAGLAGMAAALKMSGSSKTGS